MRHNRDDKRFNRNSGHLRCMMANMTRDLLICERIKTTTPKSKEVRRSAEKMITLGKSGTLSARRRAMAYLRDKVVVTKLFTELGERFKDRSGGYTRTMKVGVRHGDCAPMSLIELLDRPTEEEEAKAPSSAKAAKTKLAAPRKEKAKAEKKESPKAKPKAKVAPKKVKAKPEPKAKADPKKEKSKPKAKAAPKKAKDEKKSK